MKPKKPFKMSKMIMKFNTLINLFLSGVLGYIDSLFPGNYSKFHPIQGTCICHEGICKIMFKMILYDVGSEKLILKLFFYLFKMIYFLEIFVYIYIFVPYIIGNRNCRTDFDIK